MEHLDGCFQRKGVKGRKIGKSEAQKSIDSSLFFHYLVRKTGLLRVCYRNHMFHCHFLSSSKLNFIDQIITVIIPHNLLF